MVTTETATSRTRHPRRQAELINGLIVGIIATVATILVLSPSLNETVPGLGDLVGTLSIIAYWLGYAVLAGGPTVARRLRSRGAGLSSVSLSIYVEHYVPVIGATLLAIVVSVGIANVANAGSTPNTTYDVILTALIGIVTALSFVASAIAFAFLAIHNHRSRSLDEEAVRKAAVRMEHDWAIIDTGDDRQLVMSIRALHAESARVLEKLQTSDEAKAEFHDGVVKQLRVELTVNRLRTRATYVGVGVIAATITQIAFILVGR